MTSAIVEDFECLEPKNLAVLERIAKALENLVKIEVQRRHDELERLVLNPGRKP